jgi:hypothetical protein
MVLMMLAAHQGEEFVIILPAVMLVGAFFIMRWANQDDKTEADPAEDGLPEPEARAVGFRLPEVKAANAEVEARQETSV